MKLLEPFEIEFSGINLVEASAGTGKTYNITSLYIRALIEQDISVGKILVVTYTEAATKELKDRLLERIRESIAVLQSGVVKDHSDQFLTELLSEIDYPERAAKKLEQAVRMFDEASIYTIHGFCYQALQEQAFESGAMYDTEMIGDDSELVQEAVDDYWRNWVSEASRAPSKRPLLSFLMNSDIDPTSLSKELKTYIGKPYLKVLPQETASVEEVLQHVESLISIFNDMAEIWFAQKEQIRSLLLSKGLNGRKYRKDYLANWFAYMDTFLDGNFHSIEPFKQFENFSQSILAQNLNKGYDKPPEHKLFNLADNYLEVLSSVKRFDIIFKKGLLDYLKVELDKRKKELQVLSFDDLLLRLCNALSAPDRGRRLADRLRQKYPIAMVDEFQDTDPNQYEIFRRIYQYSDTALFMIGDPKQSIYSFRGADVYSYIEARNDAMKTNQYRLDRNFRSTPDLLRGLNAFWGHHANPFVVDEIEYQEVTWGRDQDDYDKFKEYGKKQPPIRFRRLSETGQDQQHKEVSKREVARDTADEIQRLLKGGSKGKITIGENPLEAKDIAVLVRRHKQADLMDEVLQERGIKSVRYSEQSVYESEEAKQIEQMLQAVADPADETLIKTALSLPLTGYTADELFSVEENDATWTEILQKFSDWHRMWQDQGFAAMYRSLLSDLEVAEQIVNYPNGERRLTNLLHLGELLQEEGQQHHEGTRSLLQWLARKRKDNSSSSDEEQLRLESDEALVKIVTMHKSKGLEYPVVFCPFLWFGPNISDHGQPLVYHHPKDQEISYLDLNGKNDPERAQKRFYARRESLAESLRLAYVAMTRAKHCLYLTWAFASAAEFSALGYLLQDPEQAEALLKAKVGYGPKVNFSGNEMHNTIGKLCDKYPHLFSLKPRVEEDPSGPLTLPGIDESLPDFKMSSFQRPTPLVTGYRVSSFSSLSSWMHDEPDQPDYDQYVAQTGGGKDKKLSNIKRSMFTFPKGPQPGTCIHHIFEEINFATLTNAEQQVSESLAMYGIDQQWVPIVSEMLQEVVKAPLLPSDGRLTLSALQSKELIPEMEFYYKNVQLKTPKLLSIIRNDPHSAMAIGGQAEAGFLKGFIDLTFQFEGKYYILDYKTNYLGDSYRDYQQDQLQHEMQAASYDLQYHIYTIALHRFLNQKIPNYSYEKHFGGALYLFLRGMNPKGREGIFFDCPSWDTIDTLNQYIKGGKA